jgi:hypothetical protein
MKFMVNPGDILKIKESHARKKSYVGLIVSCVRLQPDVLNFEQYVTTMWIEEKLQEIVINEMFEGIVWWRV